MHLNEGNYISVIEYADRENVSRIAVFKRIRKGKIKAYKIGRNYIVKVE